MPKPACVPCQRFFRPKQNGYRCTEMMPVVPDALPGTAEPEKWEPYKLWNADLWECNGCGAQIVVGWGNRPVSQDYLPNFAEALKTSQSIINDC